MKRFMHLGIVTMISALMVCSLALTGCGNLAPSEAETVTLTPTVDDSALITAGTLTVGLDYTYAPFAGESKGEVVGIDADVAAALAESMGLKVAYVDISEDGGPNAVADGKCDIFLSFDKETSEKSTCDYLGTYIYDAPSLFAISSDGSEVTVDTSDMTGKTVAAQENSVSAVAVSQSFGADVLVEKSNLVDAFGTLESGDTDYAAASGIVGKYIAMSYEDIVWAASLSDTPTEIGIGGLASNTVLAEGVQNALATISDNGILDLIIGKWIGSPLPFEATDTATTTDTTETTETTETTAGTETTTTA